MTLFREFRKLNESQKLRGIPVGKVLSSHAAFICIAAIFILPLFHVTFLTSWDGSFSEWQSTARLFFLPAIYVEIVICIVAVVRGLSFAKFVGNLPLSAQILLSSWLLFLCISTFFADANPEVAILGAGVWFVHLLFSIAILYLIREAGFEALRLEKLAIILSTAAAVAGLTVYVFANAKGLDGDMEWVSYLPGFANIRHTGYIFAPAIAISLASIAAKPSEFVKTHILLIIVNSALLLWLGSRGPVFGILVAFVVCFVCFSEMRSFRFLSKAALAAISGALISILAPLPRHDAFGALQRFWNTSSDPGEFSSGRISFWIEAWQLIVQRPLVGYGPFQFQIVSTNAAGIFKHPHNSILQFLFDWGVIGGLSFLALMGLAVYAAFFIAKSPSYVRLISVMGFTTISAYSLIDGLFFYAYPIAISIVFLVIPIATGFPWKEKPGQ